MPFPPSLAGGGPMGPMMRMVPRRRPKPFGGRETPDEERAELRASKRDGGRRGAKRKPPMRGGYGR